MQKSYWRIAAMGMQQPGGWTKFSTRKYFEHSRPHSDETLLAAAGGH